MKLITAFLRANKLEDVKSALEEAGLYGLSCETVRGYGRQMGRTDKYSGSTYAVNLLPKLRIEVAIKDEDLDLALDAISGACRSGEIGDGKIFVSDLTDVIRIRTGEHGDPAI